MKISVAQISTTLNNRNFSRRNCSRISQNGKEVSGIYPIRITFTGNSRGRVLRHETEAGLPEKFGNETRVTNIHRVGGEASLAQPFL